MIGLDKVQEIAAQKGISESLIEKDYILDWVLWGISQAPGLRDNLVFKGGTALHKMYFEDWRFSVDLDFTTMNKMTPAELTSNFQKVCKSVNEVSGNILNFKTIETVNDESSGNMSFFEIKLEYVGPRKQQSGDLPTITNHITDKELVFDTKIQTLVSPYPDIPEQFFLHTYSLEEIVAEKLRTIIYQRCWARDIYDTWRLLREYNSVLRFPEVMEVYELKCHNKGFDSEASLDLSERILKQKLYWESGLKKQIKNVPSFELVSGGLPTLIKEMFEKHTKLKGGKMIPIQYSIKFKKDNIEIEVCGDKSFVESKFKELIELRSTGELEVKKPNAGLQVENVIDKRPSLAEFVKSRTYKGHSELILLFAYFLEKSERVRSFNITDIQNCYKNTRIPEVKNIPLYIGKLISDGYLIEEKEKKDNKKAWSLTATGIDYVESLPASNSLP